MVGASSVTQSLAHPPSMGQCELYAPRASSATVRITAPLLNLPAPGRPPARPPGSWSRPPPGRTRPRQLSQAGRPPPCGGTGAGSCNCSTQRPKEWRAGVKRWSQKLKRMICQRKVSASDSFTHCMHELMLLLSTALIVCVLFLIRRVCVSVLGKIRSAVGSAQLLMSQKFQQFYWLCQQNLVRHLSKRDYGCVCVPRGV